MKTVNELLDESWVAYMEGNGNMGIAFEHLHGAVKALAKPLGEPEIPEAPLHWLGNESEAWRQGYGSGWCDAAKVKGQP